MKMAIAVDGNFVSQHFGHCEGFHVVNIENKKVVNRDFIKNPGHKPGFLPRFLAEKNINVIVAGGMGQSAKILFNDNGIEVITGASGSVDDIVNIYINNTLESSDEVCEGHGHHGDCGK